MRGLVIANKILSTGQMQINLPRCPVVPPTNNSGSNVCTYFDNTATCDLSLALGNKMASFKDFNVVSFGGFHANTGDV
jgi:hypothetical protein